MMTDFSGTRKRKFGTTNGDDEDNHYPHSETMGADDTDFFHTDPSDSSDNLAKYFGHLTPENLPDEAIVDFVRVVAKRTTDLPQLYNLIGGMSAFGNSPVAYGNASKRAVFYALSNIVDPTNVPAKASVLGDNLVRPNDAQLRAAGLAVDTGNAVTAKTGDSIWDEVHKTIDVKDSEKPLLGDSQVNSINSLIARAKIFFDMAAMDNADKLLIAYLMIIPFKLFEGNATFCQKHVPRVESFRAVAVLTNVAGMGGENATMNDKLKRYAGFLKKFLDFHKALNAYIANNTGPEKDTATEKVASAYKKAFMGQETPNGVLPFLYAKKDYDFITAAGDVSADFSTGLDQTESDIVTFFHGDEHGAKVPGSFVMEFDVNTATGSLAVGADLEAGSSLHYATTIHGSSGADLDIDIEEHLTALGLSGEYFRYNTKRILSFGFNAYERSIAVNLLAIPLTKGSLRKIASADLPLPVGFLLFRPFITHTMGSGVCCKAGEATGATFVGAARFELADDALRQVHYGSMTMSSRSVVMRHQNVRLIEDISFQQYQGGNNLAFFKTREQMATMSDSNISASMISAIVPYVRSVECDTGALGASGSYPNPISVTGKYNIDLLRSSELHYPGAKQLAAFWGFNGSAAPDPAAVGFESRVARNPLCYAGAQINFNCASGMHDLLVSGSGHLGTPCPGTTAKLRNGLLVPHFAHVAGAPGTSVASGQYTVTA
jgi:hypothetical protein